MGKPILAIVGGDSLLGRDLSEMLAERIPAAVVKLIGVEETDTVFTEQAGEPALITGLDEENLSGAQVVFFAGSRASSRKAFELIRKPGGSLVIDLSHTLDDHPEARLRAPMVEPTSYQVPISQIHVVAHPAAIVLAAFLDRLHGRYPVDQAVMQIFEPASERGKPGLDELQQQTISLLSFRNLPKQLFDEQLSFNLLARYGSEAPERLETIEQRIDRHLATLLSLSSRAPMPSLRLIQAPVFHGYSISVWAQLEENPGTAMLAEALACAQIEVRSSDEEAPTNVGVAGQSGMTVGVIEPDRNNARAAWFWIVADNFRVAAENAIAVAQSALTGSGAA
jgi:aspartate-semialdehyde dehydrogenase